MDNFQLIQNTKLYFGRGEERKVGERVRYYADNCLIVHDDGGYIEDLLAEVKESLRSSGVRYIDFGGVKANPRLSKANEGIEICRAENIGFILAVGGGSVMDTAKYIAFATNYKGKAVTYQMPEKIRHAIVPHGTIVTLSGTGSEFSDNAMIVDDVSSEVKKYCVMHPNAMFFDFAIVNPELTYSLPAKQLAAGAMDIISHCLEVYLGAMEELPLMEGYMETVIKTVLKYTPLALKSPCDYTVRSNLSIAAMMPTTLHMSYGGIRQDWGCHHIENQITTEFNNTHGVILGILTPSYIRYMYKKNPRPFVNWAVNCMGAERNEESIDTVVEEGAGRLEAWLKEIGLPTSFSEIGIQADMLEKIAEKSAPAGRIYQLSKEEIMEIYKMACRQGS